MTPRFLTVSEVAVALRVSRMTVYRLTATRKLASTRVGHSIRIPAAALDEYLVGKTSPALPRNGTTSDPHDPRLTHGADASPTEMAPVYLVLSPADRAKGFVRPVRRTYVHVTCGVATRMGEQIAETYARDPRFYGSTWCVQCKMHRPVGPGGEFVWEDGSKVGS